eukprot:TRINITY_DN62920_c0_g1_i1.p1 TRINITY_DN62920_c0_g1~~TRINITY_DN62920_c0_g1_i1.p1  ORF type:complete len:462 (-),score=56.85 TRINITY_DN62920_c0_g1_i1:101-1486(-)
MFRRSGSFSRFISKWMWLFCVRNASSAFGVSGDPRLRFFVHAQHFKEDRVLSIHYRELYKSLLAHPHRSQSPEDARVFFLGTDTGCALSWPHYGGDETENYVFGSLRKCRSTRTKRLRTYLESLETFRSNNTAFHVVFDMFGIMTETPADMLQNSSVVLAGPGFCSGSYRVGVDVSFPVLPIVRAPLVASSAADVLDVATSSGSECAIDSFGSKDNKRCTAGARGGSERVDPATGASRVHASTHIFRREPRCVVVGPAAWRYLMVFRGTNTSSLRRELATLHNGKDIFIHVKPFKEKVSTDTLPSQSPLVAEYLDLMTQTRFAIIPRGDNDYTTRLFEAICFGAVPVILADTWVLPFHEDGGANYTAFSLRFRQTDWKRLPALLSGYSDSVVCAMQQEALRACERHFGSVDAQVDTLLAILSRRAELQRRQTDAGMIPQTATGYLAANARHHRRYEPLFSA